MGRNLKQGDKGTSEIYLHSAIIYHVLMKLKEPFAASFGNIQDKHFLLVELIDRDGVSGWGESVAFTAPWYNEETLETNHFVIEHFLLPELLHAPEPIRHPDEVSARFRHIRRNNMAKAALEEAVWDIYARKTGQPLAHALGGRKNQIDVGVSIGIQKTVPDLLHLIENYVTQGYKRIKIKIKPGWDVGVLREIRRHFPDIALMADANSAYTLNDLDHLKQLDEFDLMMVEQPLDHDDIIDHARLQKELRTPLCLDESIHSFEDARKALELGSCRIINIKIGRVGGLTEAKRIHDFCMQEGVPVWCGGMLESGVGRAHNIALTTLDQFTLPGDTSASSRYWEEDIITPEVTVDRGTITVPAAPGIGYEVNRDLLRKYTVSTRAYQASNS